MEVNYNQLLSLYQILAGYEKSSVSIQDDVNTINLEGSIWPNLSYVNCYCESLEAKTLRNWIEKRGNKDFLLLTPSQNLDLAHLKSQKIRIIDQWTCMERSTSTKEEVIKNAFHPEVLNLNDLETWTSLVSKCLFNGKFLSPKVFLFLSQKNCELLTVKDGGNCIATSLICFDGSNCAGLYMISVAPEYRGMGIGKLITTFSIERVANKNVHLIELQATKQAVNLYKSLGFEPCGKINLLWQF